MAKSEKSKAELYREERKKRIASAAKQNARKSKRHPNAGRIVGRVIGIVLIAAIVCGAVFGVLATTGVIARAQTAFTVGSHKISVAEYGYMYYMQFQNLVNNAQQSEQQYGYNMYGFDYTKLPEEQDSPYQDDDGNTIKWSEQLKKNTIDYMQEFYTMYDQAVAAGYTVNDEEKADIEENISELRKTASGAESTSENAINMSLNAYLKVSYGSGITESFMRSLMEKEMIVQRFSEEKENSFREKYTDEEVDKMYGEDKSAYDVVDLRWYAFEPETLTAGEGESEEALQKRQEAENANALKDADALLAKATDEAAFSKAAEEIIRAKEEPAETAEETKEEAEETKEETKETQEAAEETEETADAAETAEDTAQEAAEEEHDYDADTKHYATNKSTLSSSISEDAADWAFAAGRKAGDKKSFANANGAAYAVYVVKAEYPQPTVDVRHILFMTVDSSSGEALSEDEVKEKKAKADEVLAQWEALEDKTEEAFGNLADENSEDTGSNTNGGLYENVTPGMMVDSFDKWIFDKSRKEGDVEMIESEYGYHIMYYVGNPNYAYRNTIRTENTQNDYSSWLEEELGKDSSKVTENAAGLEKGYKRAAQRIETTVQYLQQNASTSAAG